MSKNKEKPTLEAISSDEESDSEMANLAQQFAPPPPPIGIPREDISDSSDDEFGGQKIPTIVRGSAYFTLQSFLGSNPWKIIHQYPTITITLTQLLTIPCVSSAKSWMPKIFSEICTKKLPLKREVPRLTRSSRRSLALVTLQTCKI